MALVVTLLMMSILVMMVVGLAGVMRSEQAAARNLTYQVIADQMAELGAKQAMAAVLSNSTGSIGEFSATGPGWMFTNKVFVPLFSSNSAGQMKNLEEIGTNSLVFSLPASGARGRIMACWTNVLAPSASQPLGRYAWWVDDEGTKVNLNATGSNNTNRYLPLLTNFPISADWIFSDPYTFVTNAASFVQASALLRRTNFLPTVESLKDTNLVNPGTTPANKIQGTNYNRWKGSLTVWSSNVDLTPWGTPKFNLADLTNTVLYPQPSNAMAAVASYLRTNGMTNLFPGGMTLARKYGGGSNSSTNVGNHGDLILQQIAANLMSSVGRPVLLTNAGDTFGRRGDYQPSNPATSYLRHRNFMPTSVASHYQGPFLDQVRARVDWLIVTNVTSTNVQGRLAIWVSVVNPSTNTFADWSLSVQPRKWKFVLQPTANRTFANAKVVGTPAYGSPLAGKFSGVPDMGQRIVAGPAWEIGTSGSTILNNSWPLGAIFVTNMNFSPRSSTDIIFTNIISYNVTDVLASDLPMEVSKAYVMLDQVCLYASASPSRVFLRDWLTHDDLGQSGNYRTVMDVGQFDFDQALSPSNPKPIGLGTNTFPILTTNDFTAATSHGVRKIDPQVRFPVCHWDTNLTAAPFNMGILKSGGFPATMRVWTTNTAFSCTNTNGSVTGIPYLWPDPAPGVTTVNSHPHFSAGYYPENGFKSVAQLGAIHTGIPWRTLRLQPQPRVEMLASNGATNSPPDWILLDAFTATNATNPRVMVNLNGFPMAFGGPATNSDTKISTRAISLASLMGAAARGAAPTSISNGVPASLTNASSAYTNLNIMASNLAAGLTAGLTNTNAWTTNSAWGMYRNDIDQRSKFPTNGFLFAGEILEMRGMAEDTNAVPSYGEDVVEGRLRSFLDLATTRSDTFTVWSAGQGLAVNTNRSNRTNVMAEVRKQTVFQRVPMFNPAGTAVTNYQIKILYTRNHLVE